MDMTTNYAQNVDILTGPTFINHILKFDYIVIINFMLLLNGIHRD